ncbi:MAG TPA: hypothetical protein VFU05_20055, partial [Cyclobacteriaceae bacterium]|nr:hypothetical protein [Cyclobacteriaceae bacterium]
TDIFETRYNVGTPQEETTENVNFNRISFAIDFATDKGFVHEVEILIPEVFKPLDKFQYPMNYELRKGDTFDGTASSASVRYELNKSLTGNEGKFSFLLGAGINPYYVRIEYEPHDLTTYRLLTEFFGFALNVTPRIQYKFGQRFSMDLNVPLKIYDLRMEASRIFNPNIPIRDQKVQETSNIFFETAYTIRLGLLYKFTPS